MKKLSFLAGLIVGALLIPTGAYLYFAGGYAPVATAAAPMPFEKTLARTALHARLTKEMPKSVPIEPTEENLLAGAALYNEQCAVCHVVKRRPPQDAHLVWRERHCTTSNARFATGYPTRPRPPSPRECSRSLPSCSEARV